MTNANTMNLSADVIVGIDLGTTNSLLAVYHEGKVHIIDIDGSQLLPSYVGLSPSDELLVGHPARNQYILYPERTIKSIKRRMGGTEKVELGNRSLLPEEISALILSHLKSRAEKELGIPIRRAVITVPAYFNDTQRQATRAAGEIAGLEVVRIINEPTAASLAFRNSVLSKNEEKAEISAVYDLGGGTFDVSIVREEGDITEVLASRGDTRLGGDDFDRLILDHFLSHIQSETRLDVRENRRIINRLTHAAEAAKIELSANPYVHVIEEGLTEVDGKTIHLDLELTRTQYEEMIHSMTDRTIHCIQQALHDANVSPSEVNNVLLVGGSTRTPFVREILKNYFQQEPRSEIHPDLCVVIGAAILAARIQGLDIERLLVDITPYTFGVQAVGMGEDGYPTDYLYVPIILRNTPLPVTRSEEFSTLYDNQTRVEVNIFQGENPDVRNNIKIGKFVVEGLSKSPAGNRVIDRMSLDLNGILTVTAIEKKTGVQKTIKIEGADKPKSAQDIADSRNSLSDLLPAGYIDIDGDIDDADFAEDSDSGLIVEHLEILDRAKAALEKMHPDDRREAEELCKQIFELASDGLDYEKPLTELREILYFVGA